MYHLLVCLTDLAEGGLPVPYLCHDLPQEVYGEMPSADDMYQVSGAIISLLSYLSQRLFAFTNHDGPRGLRAPIDVASNLVVCTNASPTDMSGKELICGDSRTGVLINRH